MITVLTFGTFDIFHPWHEHYLREAKKHGDKLVTVIGRDQTVFHLKGNPPKNNENQRKKRVEESAIADSVVLGDLENYYACITEQKADIVCLGYDQKHLADGLQRFLDTHNLNIQIIRIQAFQPEKYKSSKLW